MTRTGTPIRSSLKIIKMSEIVKKMMSLDNGGRRSGGDRRNYSYTLHIPERRSGKDRRSGEDRRKTPRLKIVPNE